jgi:GNAT superfamily N-acetyltransferase
VKIEIRPARPEEAGALSDLSVRSKGHWGYSPEVLERWRPAMVITPDYIRTEVVRSIFADDALVGFYALKLHENLLDHLWLAPEAIGRGIGKTAFLHATAVAHAAGLRTLIIISDADAVGFYLRHGAQKIGEVCSPLQNRMLPKLAIALSSPEEVR